MFHRCLIKYGLSVNNYMRSIRFSTSHQKNSKLDKNTIRLLERLSLVNFEDSEHIAVLEEAIKFADRITDIDITNIQPLVSVLEDSCLKLRDDQIIDGNCKTEILRNAPVIEEDYFVIPPGNIAFDCYENIEKPSGLDKNSFPKSLSCENRRIS